MAEDLRTPLQKATDAATRYIDMTYEYCDRPDQLPVKHSAVFDPHDRRVYDPFDRWLSFYTVLQSPLRWTDADGHNKSLQCAEFREKLLKRVEIMPCQFHAILYQIFHKHGVKGRVYAFINANLSRIVDCRERYMKERMRRQGISDAEINEIIQQQLLAIAAINRTKALNDCELRKDVSLRLIDYPGILSVNQL